MIIGTGVVYLRAEWVTSLKEKRMIVKSLVEKTKHKFNVSVAEVDKQDAHQEIVIGFACVTNEKAHADSVVNHVLNFIERSTDAVVEKVEVEFL